MFKLVVLCAFFAAVAAKPDILVWSPLAEHSTLVSPGSTTITKSASSVIHPSPLYSYSAPLAYTHFIKKRSPQWPLSYGLPNTYLATNPLGATTYNSIAPATYTSIHPGAFTTTHLIKKRSPQLLTSSFITPTAYSSHVSPIFSPNQAFPSVISPSWISSNPWNSQAVSVAHLIKKRSAPLLTSYSLPTSVSHQARFDLQSTPYVTSLSTPYAYSSPLGYSHIF